MRVQGLWRVQRSALVSAPRRARRTVPDMSILSPARRLWRALLGLGHGAAHLLDDQETSTFPTPIAPYGADGKRTRIFPFNGNGIGR